MAHLSIILLAALQAAPQVPAASPECFEPDKSFQRRRALVSLGLTLPSLALSFSGLMALSTMRQSVGEDVQEGPVCTIGKPCGGACIDMEEVCHVGTDERSKLTRKGVITSSILMSTGFALAVTMLVVVARMRPKRIACNLSGCALKIQF